MKPHNAILLTTVSFLSVAAAAPKPVYESHRVTAETVGHAVDIDVDLSGAKKLYLVITDGGDGYMADWAEWLSPVIFGTGYCSQKRWWVMSLAMALIWTVVVLLVGLPWWKVLGLW